MAGIFQAVNLAIRKVVSMYNYMLFKASIITKVHKVNRLLRKERI